jgi:hypothetical protein
MGSSSLRYYMSVVDAYQLRVTLHPVSGDPRRCEVHITADMRQGVKKNARVGMLLGGITGGVGASIGIMTSLVAGIGVAAVPVGAGVLALMGGGMIGVYRWSFQWGLKRARRELEHLLDSVGAHARSQDVFGVPAPTAQGLPARRPLGEGRTPDR